MYDDRVCPACQTVLPAGRSVCPKCGTNVAPPKTGLSFIDIPGRIYRALVEDFGPVGAAIFAGLAFLVLVGLFIAAIAIRSMH